MPKVNWRHVLGALKWPRILALVRGFPAELVGWQWGRGTLARSFGVSYGITLRSRILRWWRRPGPSQWSRLAAASRSRLTRLVPQRQPSPPKLSTVLASGAGLASRIVTWAKGLRAPEWHLVKARARELPTQLGTSWRELRSIRWSAVFIRARSLPGSFLAWWRKASLRKRSLLVAAPVLVAAILLGFFMWTGISAALDARQAYRELQAEMSHLTPVDLIQASVYQSLEGRFREAEKRSATARSSLGFLKAFTWVPGIGSQIKEAHLLLEMGYYQGRGSGNLAEAYRAAISLPLEDLPPDVVAEQIARMLQGSLPQLDQAQQDLRRVAELGEHLEDTERGARYSALVKRYLPALQTVVYLSRTSPSVIGHTYALSRELSSLQELAVDPLDVMENPEEVGRVLANITDQASALEQSLNVVRQATKAIDERDTPELTKVIEVLDTLVPGVSLLKHVTAGTRSLVTMAEAIESEGFLSQEFGAVVGVALDDARQELALAREEVSSLQELLSVQGIDAEAFLPSIVFGGDSDVPLSTTQRVEVLLDDAISGADFLYSLLGYDGKRTYLLVGQNPNEIRATGGFIGIAVEVKVDKGELIDLVYHDSVLVDQEPLTDNPRPPEGLFWYLWMGRLLFRDSNWNPHFPSSAAKVAEIFTLGQGVQVDGVITATKRLAIDLVTLFGDIKVPGLKDVLTKKTATLYTETENLYECQPRHISIRPKRCFDEDLFFALQDRLTSRLLKKGFYGRETTW